MIKFFRNLRQNMLIENKVSKYLLYAIGEIVLVVIGILIALQINNWNTGRIEKKNEFNLVQKMIDQTVADSIMFQYRMDGLLIMDSILSYVININTDTINRLPDRAFTGSLHPVLKWTTGSNLVRNHSDDFKNITNLNLREELMDYSYLSTMMNGALDLYSQNLQDHLIPLELKFHARLKAFDRTNTLGQMKGLFKNEDIDSYFNLFKRLNNNAVRQVQNLQEKNIVILDTLKAYKAHFYD